MIFLLFLWKPSIFARNCNFTQPAKSCKSVPFTPPSNHQIIFFLFLIYYDKVFRFETFESLLTQSEIFSMPYSYTTHVYTIHVLYNNNRLLYSVMYNMERYCMRRLVQYGFSIQYRLVQYLSILYITLYNDLFIIQLKWSIL
jgi:hypothetical protein